MVAVTTVRRHQTRSSTGWRRGGLFGHGHAALSPFAVSHCAHSMETAEIPLKPRPRLPEWLRIKLPTSDTFARTRELLNELRLHTVCESAKCPNHWECWSKGTATFMIAGDRCTRACGFCAVTTAKPFALEADEPQRVAEATRRMGLRHVVITAVARDDLPDGGAEHLQPQSRDGAASDSIGAPSRDLRPLAQGARKSESARR